MIERGWAAISDIASKNLIGLTGRPSDFTTSMSGIITPLVFGFFMTVTGCSYGRWLVGALALPFGVERFTIADTR